MDSKEKLRRLRREYLIKQKGTLSLIEIFRFYADRKREKEKIK